MSTLRRSGTLAFVSVLLLGFVSCAGGSPGFSEGAHRYHPRQSSGNAELTGPTAAAVIYQTRRDRQRQFHEDSREFRRRGW